MALQINILTQKEMEIIVSALHAVSSTGGGSETWHLANKIANLHQIEPNYPQVGVYQKNAHAEIEEYLHGS